MPDQPFAAFEQQLCAAADGRMRVLGIRRSGQHAVINWILRNAGRADTVFLNSCTMRRSALRTCGQSELNGRPSGGGYPLLKVLTPWLTPEKRPFVLVSYEAGYAEGGLTPNFPDEDFDREVLVTRSFVNWLPSFLRLMRVMNPRWPAEGLEVAHGVLFEMTRYKAHLLAAQASPHVVVDFDQWASRPAYRLEKLAELGLDNHDNSLGHVQPYGGGSSFSGHKTPADALPLTTRWQSMAADPFAQQCLRLALADSAFMDSLAISYPDDARHIATLLAQS